MIYLIWLDKDGKELRRKPKGRGRSPTEAVRQDDGNWHIVEQEPSPASETELPVRKRQLRIRREHADKPISVSEIVEKCSCISIDRQSGIIVLHSPIPKHDLGFEEFAFNNIYFKVELDPGNCQIRVFAVSSPEIPCAIIENALVRLNGDSQCN